MRLLGGLPHGWRVVTTIGSTSAVPVMTLRAGIPGNPCRPLYLGQVCAAIGVPERTLRNHCMEHLGMGPAQYLWLRRMDLARRSLALSVPNATTVTAVANDHGFGELGRFAVEYRKLFGEAPSQTLRRPVDVPRPADPDDSIAFLPKLT
jgi:AraC-like DNA-binding protein